MKICPRCAEEVQEEAVVCRYCGYDFERRRGSEFGKSDLAGCALQGCAIWIFGPIVLVILVLIFFGGSSPKPAAPPEPAVTAPAVQPGTIHQAELDAMFPNSHKRKLRHHSG